jgi:hypothetical protein
MRDEPRLTVVVPTMALLESLVRHLGSRFRGGTGVRGVEDGSQWIFCHYDVPKTAEQEAVVRAAIDAWAKAVGADDVEVTVQLPMPIDPGSVTEGVLTWKVEDGPEDAPLEGSPDDVGPAWVTLYAGEEELSTEQLNDGDWLTRAEAERVAAENGYTFAADD